MADGGKTDKDVVVIGGGPAAAAVVQALRERGHDGSVLLACADGPPVFRPTVVADYLRTLDPAVLRPGAAGPRGSGAGAGVVHAQ